ncbi:MAG: acyltransferase [Promethearchaeati archaeon]
MKKSFIIAFLFLLLSASIIILIIINRIFIDIPIIDLIYENIAPLLYLFFFDYSLYIYAITLITYVLLMLIFILGYNIAKNKQLSGSIMYIFSLFGIVLVTFIIITYAYFGILFHKDISLNTRFMFLLLLMPVNIGFNVILFLVSIDFFVFLKDLVSARHVWKHEKPEFEIRTEGKMTHIDIYTDQHIFTPIPMLIIANHLQKERFSIAWFVKGAFNHLLSLIISYLTGWPRARNILFKFLGMKIGDNCHISERSVPDPLLPELIEFEDGSGCGIGVKLITHNAMTLRHTTFSYAPIKICENARIGAYSFIMPGVTIGKGSIIGANSVVTQDIPPYSIAIGSPAKVVKKFTEDEKKEIDQEFKI